MAEGEEDFLGFVSVVDVVQMIFVHEVVEFGQLLLRINRLLRRFPLQLLVLRHIFLKKARHRFGFFLPQHLHMVHVLNALGWHLLFVVVLG